MGVGCQMCTPRAVCRLQKKEMDIKEMKLPQQQWKIKRWKNIFPFFSRLGDKT